MIECPQFKFRPIFAWGRCVLGVFEVPDDDSEVLWGVGEAVLEVEAKWWDFGGFWGEIWENFDLQSL